jgi:hypothetical protein
MFVLDDFGEPARPLMIKKLLLELRVKKRKKSCIVYILRESFYSDCFERIDGGYWKLSRKGRQKVNRLRRLQQLYVIYRIYNKVTGQSYVGQTKEFSSRIYQHFHHLRTNSHNNERLQEAFDFYGEGAFAYEILEENIPAYRRFKAEFQWCNTWGSFRVTGYNKAIPWWFKIGNCE